jgi:hypothetical protein
LVATCGNGAQLNRRCALTRIDVVALEERISEKKNEHEGKSSVLCTRSQRLLSDHGARQFNPACSQGAFTPLRRFRDNEEREVLSDPGSSQQPSLPATNQINWCWVGACNPAYSRVAFIFRHSVKTFCPSMSLSWTEAFAHYLVYYRAMSSLIYPRGALRDNLSSCENLWAILTRLFLGFSTSPLSLEIMGARYTYSMLDSCAFMNSHSTCVCSNPWV